MADSLYLMLDPDGYGYLDDHVLAKEVSGEDFEEKQSTTSGWNLGNLAKSLGVKPGGYKKVWLTDKEPKK
jgi:hypothetical protein